MGFLKCAGYMALTGAIGFVIGRLAPKKWFHFDRFPYKSFAFEKGGKLYHKLKIRKWQNKIPDMSKILPGVMPKKKLPDDAGKQEVEVMLRETCVAEFVHGALCVSGLFCLRLWRGVGGVIATVVYILLGNLPFIVIQRYNRPRLVKLYNRLKRAEENTNDKTREKEVCGF